MNACITSIGPVALVIGFVATARALVPSELIYVCENASGRVSAIDAAGVVTAFATGLGFPAGIAADQNGNLYVTSFGAGSRYGVQKLDPQGSATLFANLPFQMQPFGMAFDGSGNLYVANSNRISRITPAGAVSDFALVNGRPTGLAFDTHSNLFVGVGDSVLKITPNKIESTVASLSSAFGLAFDPGGNLFASSLAGGTISKISPGGGVSIFASGLSSPRGLAFDSAGELLVSEEGTGAIDKISPSGSVTTLATGLSSPQFMVVEPVPEPSTMVLLGLFGGVTLVRLGARIWQARFANR